MITKIPYTLLVEVYKGRDKDTPERYADSSDRTVRLIVFETDPDNGAKCVNDICEITLSQNDVKHDSDIRYISGFVAHHFESGCVFHELHDKVDFGKSTRFDSKIMKIVKAQLWDLDHPAETAEREERERRIEMVKAHEQRIWAICDELAALNPAAGMSYEGNGFTVELKWTKDI